MCVHNLKEKEEFLRRLVQTGTLDSLGPSVIQSMYKAQFGKMKPRTFGNKLLQIRRELGKPHMEQGKNAKAIMKTEKSDDGFIDNGDQSSDSENDAKKSKAGPSSQPTNNMKEIIESNAGAQFLFADNDFMPIYCMAPWANHTDLRNKYLSVAIWLNSVMRKNDFSLDIVDNVEYLLYKVKWCEAMGNQQKIHEMKLKRLDGGEKITPYHPQIEDFIELLQNISHTDDGQINGIARIQLPFVVESRFHMQFLNWKSSNVAVFYLVLRQPSEKKKGADAVQVVDL